MPFGFWVLGDTAWVDAITFLIQVSNAFRLLGSGGRQPSPQSYRGTFKVSNAFRLLGSGGRPRRKRKRTTRTPSLKCLSAFGFWGTDSGPLQIHWLKVSSQMPFGFWVLGDCPENRQCKQIRHVSQMPFGFWVLGDLPLKVATCAPRRGSLKCLSAFGFWGTSPAPNDTRA